MCYETGNKQWSIEDDRHLVTKFLDRERLFHISAHLGRPTSDLKQRLCYLAYGRSLSSLTEFRLAHSLVSEGMCGTFAECAKRTGISEDSLRYVFTQVRRIRWANINLTRLRRHLAEQSF